MTFINIVKLAKMDKNIIRISSGRLDVDIAKPGSIYRGSRFDWMGFTMQVTLDGVHTFCVPESKIPGKGTNGSGLCNEFGIFNPIGYDDALPGEQFPKLGVGLLTRPDDRPYHFAYPYDIVPFPVHMSVEEDRVAFTMEPVNCRGYAARLEKSIRVSGNCLCVEYRLENKGYKPINTHEYNHNFVGFDSHDVGPGYRLKLPYSPHLEEIPDVMHVEGEFILWNQTPGKDFYCRPTGYPPMAGHCWELVCEPAGTGMREKDDFKVSMLALWGRSHVVSLEVFKDISLEPEQSDTWARHYEFFCI